ncbi:hypothetical protein EYC84_000337 [Monilinia fructicola]|uniref:FAD-binding PCMH-type domain-containing protein n=1 Tax=Monilinia fructicola TaxID=38448 RepID=A0A5M9JNW9_MONFR|nr:hypothetical protein EYC84_000337 [Monilinia fructicola]
MISREQSLDAAKEDVVLHVAVNACLFPLIGAVGKHVITIEGIGDADHPHPLQERIAKLHGSQCGFCTPGIVMSLYALIRNSYDPISKVFQLSASDVELEGHLDGNLCRCTGYKPILQAAKTFITDDLKGEISIPRSDPVNEGASETGLPDVPSHSEIDPLQISKETALAEGLEGAVEIYQTMIHAGLELALQNILQTEAPLDVPRAQLVPSTKILLPQIAQWYLISKDIHHSFTPYRSQTEHIFPPALRNFTRTPLRYGNHANIWLLPTTLEQLLLIKEEYPTAKLVCGASETQVEVRVKYASFPVSVYVSEIEELQGITIPDDDEKLQLCTEISNIRVPLSPPDAREIIKAYKQAKRKDDDIAIVTAAFRVRLDKDYIASQVSLVYGGMAPMTVEVPKTMNYLVGKSWHSLTTLSESMKILAAELDLKIRRAWWNGVISSNTGAPAIESGLALGYVDVNSIPKDANLWGSIIKDEPFFADGEVFSHGQPIGLVYANTALQAQAAARAVRVEYEDLPVILTIDEAIDANSYFPYGRVLKKGAAIEDKMDDIWASCDKIFEGNTRIGGQEHFYLETNAALVIPNKEDGTYEVWSSTQNSMETQEFVAQVTGVPSSRVNARVKRMGGAFGGKESRSVQLACLLAVAQRRKLNVPYDAC